MRSLRPLLLPVALLASLLLAPTAGGDETGGALTAERIRIGEHPAYVRVVVDFAGGALAANEVQAVDPDPFDGTAALRVTRAGIHAHAFTRTEHGVMAQVVQGSGRLRIVLSGAARRFKHVSYAVVGGDRLAIDLWRSRPPSAQAQVRVGADGCLTLREVVLGERLIRAGGRERDLFEHGLTVRVRAAGGGVVGQRHVIAADGRWRARVPYRVRRLQAGTLEAVATSAKDGALVCLAQVRVVLPPR